MAILLPEHSINEIAAIIFKELKKGVVQKKHPFRNVVLNTIADDMPKSRWVVFRKLTEEQRFLIFTDIRSAKVKELKLNSNCNLLFYNNRHGIQIRIEGACAIHHHDELTKKYWPGIPGNSAKSYITVLAPGSSINQIEQSNELIDPNTD